MYCLVGEFEVGRNHLGRRVRRVPLRSLDRYRSAGLIRAEGTLVTVTGPTKARPSGGLTIDFVVVPDRAQLSELVQRVRVGRLRTNIGNLAALDDAVAAFNRTERIKGKTIIRVDP
jgi:hypothetical protein